MNDHNDNNRDEHGRFLHDVASHTNFDPTTTSIMKRNNKLKELLFFILGIGMLLPFTMFITANGYFKYKFQSHPQISKNFENMFAICSQVPCVIGAVMALLLTGKVSQTLRIIVSLSVITLCLALTAVFVYIDTRAWTEDLSLIHI